MKSPYKYPELYAELARQGKTKQSLAASIGVSAAGLRYKQREGDFSISEMNRAAMFLNCGLYDEGFKRLGCIGCPMAGNAGMRREFARWPHMYRYYRKAFAAYLARRGDKSGAGYNWRTVDDVWHWWLEDGVVPGQIEMDLEDAL